MADLFELGGVLPPLTREAEREIFPDAKGAVSGRHTVATIFLSQEEFERDLLPRLERTLDSETVAFIRGRVEKTFLVRRKLEALSSSIEAIIGKGNFSALWLDREAFSADSMEHRGLITEAVARVYSADALQKLVRLLYENGIPMIPYGEGGGYNMGVTPMAPAITVSLRGIDHISPIRPSRRGAGRYEVSVGAGVPFKDLIAYLGHRGYVLRCDPNTPRAATGGIAATGSNGGRKAFEVVLHGRAVTAHGTAVTFAADAAEARAIASEPFLLARKFFSIEDPALLSSAFARFERAGAPACIDVEAEDLVVPLRGVKGEANMLAQKHGRLRDARMGRELDRISPLPLSAFVGGEGCTGFIYEVTFEVERPQAFVKGMRWHLKTVESAMALTQRIKGLPQEEQPVYFEFISGQSIRRFLESDFPGVFPPGTEGTILAAVEGRSREECVHRAGVLEALAAEASPLGSDATPVKANTRLLPELEELKRPREELPKKLRTKCKTDMEIRTEYLPRVLEIVARTAAPGKQDVLFGHLTPAHTAIMHWNIGGFDLYDEEQADLAWDYLEKVLDDAQSLAPEGDARGSARFTGEHGVAGKAAFLWLNHIPEADFRRMCAVKDALDPKDLFNPDTIFLRTSYARSLRARLLQLTSERLAAARVESRLFPAEAFVASEALRCTRCNSCKVCPVIDAEHALERKGARRSKSSVLPSKRDLVMFLERIVMARRTAAAMGGVAEVESRTSRMLAEGGNLLKKCFYCRRCDKACPVDIQIHPLMRAYHELGRLPSMGSRFWGFIYDRLMGHDPFKQVTYRLLALLLVLSSPLLRVIRALPFVPRWLKTYAAPPSLSLTHYEPAKEGVKREGGDNFVFIGTPDDARAHPALPEGVVYLRFRGCFDTFGNPEATRAVDSYFREFLGARIVDLEKKMCCGFPYEADGLHEKARALQLDCLVEIVRAIAKLRERTSGAQLRVVLFSSCPTCAEALREMRERLAESEAWSRVKLRAGLSDDFPVDVLEFRVADTAELAVEVLAACPDRRAAIARIERRVGLKIPCHNTEIATQAQLDLLRLHFSEVFGYERCCGLSGTGRLKHPRIGTEISEQLFEQIAENPPEVCVSGCPSCRDGVRMQRDINKGEGKPLGGFAVRGIFEEIVG